MGYEIRNASPTGLSFCEATPEMGYWFASGMRDEDYMELQHSTGGYSVSRGELMAHTLNQGTENVGILGPGDKLIGFWGFGRLDDTDGCVWMMGAQELFDRHFIEVTRIFRKQILPALLGTEDVAFSAVHSMVWARNHEIMKWLRGSRFVETGVSDINGERFVNMTRYA